MEELAESKKSKDRSPAFPFITLEQALERSRQFYAEEKRGVAPFPRAAMHWRYSEASSGALQTVAALKSYGLMDEPGGTGKSRQLQLSELALRVILDQRPDSVERIGFVRQAALSPSVAAEVHLKWPEGLPSESTLNHFLVLDKKFNEGTALKVVKILYENQRFAAIEFGTLASDDAKIQPENMSGLVLMTSSLAEPERGGSPRTSVPSPSKGKTPHMEQFVTDDGDTVVMHFSDKPTSSLYEWISEYATFRATRLAKVEALAKGAAADKQGDGFA